MAIGGLKWNIIRFSLLHICCVFILLELVNLRPEEAVGRLPHRPDEPGTF